MKKRGLSVIIPAYNEEHRLRASLEEIAAKTGEAFSPVELIVVNDGSTDGTLSMAEEFAASSGRGAVFCRVIDLPENRGKGYAVRRGMMEASAELALMTDADLSTPIEEIQKLLLVLEEDGADIVIGSRALSASDVRVHQPWYREYGGKGFNLFVRVITMLPFSDTQCGFKLFRTAACRRIFEKQKIDRFAFDVEILFAASKAGLKIREEPVTWRHSPGSKVNMLPDSIRTFIELLRIRINSIRGFY